MPAGNRLLDGSITDAAPEFTVSVSSGGTVTVDTTQAPLLVNSATNTYRYWVQVRGNVSGTVTLTPIANSWVATDTANGQTVPNAGTLTPHAHLTTGYLDVTLAPTAHRTAVQRRSALCRHRLRQPFLGVVLLVIDVAARLILTPRKLFA